MVLHDHSNATHTAIVGREREAMVRMREMKKKIIRFQIE